MLLFVCFDFGFSLGHVACICCFRVVFCRLVGSLANSPLGGWLVVYFLVYVVVGARYYFGWFFVACLILFVGFVFIVLRFILMFSWFNLFRQLLIKFLVWFWCLTCCLSVVYADVWFELVILALTLFRFRLYGLLVFALCFWLGWICLWNTIAWGFGVCLDWIVYCWCLDFVMLVSSCCMAYVVFDYCRDCCRGWMLLNLLELVLIVEVDLMWLFAVDFSLVWFGVVEGSAAWFFLWSLVRLLVFVSMVCILHDLVMMFFVYFLFVACLVSAGLWLHTVWRLLLILCLFNLLI